MQTETLSLIVYPNNASTYPCECEMWLDNLNSALTIAESAQPYIADWRKYGWLLTLKTVCPARPIALYRAPSSQIALYRLHGAGKQIAQQFTDPDGDGDFPVVLVLCEKDGKVVARTIDYAFQLPIYCQEILTTLMDKLIETAGGES